MDVDQHTHASFPSPDAHFNSPELHQHPQASPSHSQQQQQSDQQQQQQQQRPQPSPDSPSQPQSQNPWQHQHQQHSHPHLMPISVQVPGSMSAVSASPTSYSPASAHPADSYPFHSHQSQSQAQSHSHHQQLDGVHHGHEHGHAQPGMERSASLSLNISSLSVQSPATLSPLTPSPHPSTASTAQTLSPVTPLSPSTTPHAQYYQTTHSGTQSRHSGQVQGQHNQGSMFAYAPPGDGPYGASGAYDPSQHPTVALPPYTRAPSSRSSSAASTAALSTKSSIPRKRSFHNSTALPVTTLDSVGGGGEHGYNPALHPSFEDVDVDLYAASAGGMDSIDTRGGGGGSPGDAGESSSGDGDDVDPFKSLSLGSGPHHGSGGSGNTNAGGPTTNALSIPSSHVGGGGGYAPVSAAKTTGTNNFVTKLYQMINDPKSAMFIQWTELGTSFVVTNVSEFSRTILGTHFKHNNFSSFVRQLNMYGFHKINRGRQTPRGGRASTSSGSGQNSGSAGASADQQVWEFSHHKFLRGRPDLLDEIKRKALDPDPGVKQRVELPGELAAQLGQMRENHRRVVRALEWERAKVDKLVGVVRHLSDVMSRAFPGSVAPFPPDLWETPDNHPPIFITTPGAPSPSPISATGGRGYGGLNGGNGANANGMVLPNAFSGLQAFSPGSSPTGSEYMHQGHTQHGGHYGHAAYQHQGHGGHPHHLNRAHSMQNIPYDTGFTAASPVTGGLRYDDAMELDGSFSGQGIGDRKRQRTGPGFLASTGLDGKRLSRARSDSAPLGYSAWGPGTATSAPSTSAGIPSSSATGSSVLGRPRSGSGLSQVRMQQQQSQGSVQQTDRKEELMVNISGLSGGGKSPAPGGQGQSPQGQQGATSPLVPKSAV